jgi:hypothetical protein
VGRIPVVILPVVDGQAAVSEPVQEAHFQEGGHECAALSLPIGDDLHVLVIHVAEDPIRPAHRCESPEH